MLEFGGLWWCVSVFIVGGMAGYLTARLAVNQLRRELEFVRRLGVEVFWLVETSSALLEDTLRERQGFVYHRPNVVPVLQPLPPAIPDVFPPPPRHQNYNNIPDQQPPNRPRGRNPPRAPTYTSTTNWNIEGFNVETVQNRRTRSQTNIVTPNSIKGRRVTKHF